MAEVLANVKRWRLTVWCPDCTGQDFDGCFDGGVETKEFPSREDAERAGDAATRDCIWEYEVEALPDEGDVDGCL